MLKARFCHSNHNSMDSEITMNYLMLLFSVTSEKTPFEQLFLLISAKKKKTKKNKIDDDY